MAAPNEEIAKDVKSLALGHRSFTPAGSDAWFPVGLVQQDVALLLQEYWFDSPQRANWPVSKLLK